MAATAIATDPRSLADDVTGGCGKRAAVLSCGQSGPPLAWPKLSDSAADEEEDEGADEDVIGGMKPKSVKISQACQSYFLCQFFVDCEGTQNGV